MVKEKRETQYERTALSWMRTMALSVLAILYYLKTGHFQSDLPFYLAAICLILLLFAYNRKNKLLFCTILIALLISYLFI
jgi:Ca2+/Na+ antiporter